MPSTTFTISLPMPVARWERTKPQENNTKKPASFPIHFDALLFPACSQSVRGICPHSKASRPLPPPALGIRPSSITLRPTLHLAPFPAQVPAAETLRRWTRWPSRPRVLGPAAHTQVCLLALLFLRLYVELRRRLDFLHPGSPWTGRDRRLPNRTLGTGSGLLKVCFQGSFYLVYLNLTAKPQKRKSGL